MCRKQVFKFFFLLRWLGEYEIFMRQRFCTKKMERKMQEKRWKIAHYHNASVLSCGRNGRNPIGYWTARLKDFVDRFFVVFFQEKKKLWICVTWRLEFYGAGGNIPKLYFIITYWKYAIILSRIKTSDARICLFYFSCSLVCCITLAMLIFSVNIRGVNLRIFFNFVIDVYRKSGLEKIWHRTLAPV